ncbi:uncharacterized protein LOC144128237 isoform X2 [Amblyomma americanum]
MDGDISAEQIETWAAYDRRWNETRRKRIAEETPEQRAVRLAKCREYAAARRRTADTGCCALKGCFFASPLMVTEEQIKLTTPVIQKSGAVGAMTC